MADPHVTWLKTAAKKYMDENEYTEITPEVIQHVIKVAGEQHVLSASTAIKELVIEG